MTTTAMQLGLFTGEPVPGEVAIVERDAPRPQSRKGVGENSQSAYDQNRAALHNRKQLILDVLRLSSKPMTARQILEKIWPDSDDMNRVRPRITELLKEGRLEHISDVHDERTDELVGMYWITNKA